MRRAMREIIRQAAPQSILEISGDFARGLSHAYASVNWPATDVCHDKIHGSWDMIVAEQVWEHLRYPRRATINVLNALNPGGRFLVAVPFLVKVHPAPDDCTRWTESGLHFFLHDAGFAFDEIQTGSWGNRDVVIASFTDWPEYEEGKHSLVNDPDFPYHVWAVARKAS